METVLKLVLYGHLTTPFTQIYPKVQLEQTIVRQADVKDHVEQTSIVTY